MYVCEIEMTNPKTDLLIGGADLKTVLLKLEVSVLIRTYNTIPETDLLKHPKTDLLKVYCYIDPFGSQNRSLD